MAEMGYMSPQITCLAKSQDVIGWKIFMEERISRNFFDIQNEYLTLGNHRMDAEQWTRQLISEFCTSPTANESLGTLHSMTSKKGGSEGRNYATSWKK